MSDLKTQAAEDYLKAIYEICEARARASTGQIAEALGVTPASVTGMLKKLAAADPPLVRYRKHQGVVLTEEGEKQAMRMIRRHRLLECFLHETLGYGWDEVHQEAERLEHAISSAFGRRIAQLLDEPERDPHGSPIPTADLRLPSDCAVSLAEVAAGQRARVERVSDRDPQLLRYLEEISLLPGTEIAILEPLPFSDHVRVEHEQAAEPLIIGAPVAREVFVTILNSAVEETPEEIST